VAQVTVNFVGVDLLGGGQKKTTIKVDGDLPLTELFRLLARQLAIESLEEGIDGRFLVLVDGIGVDWRRKSEVVISPGSIVSIAPLVAGGSR
jgi:hypothetical protein